MPYPAAAMDGPGGAHSSRHTPSRRTHRNLPRSEPLAVGRRRRGRESAASPPMTPATHPVAPAVVQEPSVTRRPRQTANESNQRRLRQRALRACRGINESIWPKQSRNRIANSLGATREAWASPGGLYAVRFIERVRSPAAARQRSPSRNTCCCRIGRGRSSRPMRVRRGTRRSARCIAPGWDARPQTSPRPSGRVVQGGDGPWHG